MLYKGCIGRHEGLFAKIRAGSMFAQLAMLLVVSCTFEGFRNRSLSEHSVRNFSMLTAMPTSGKSTQKAFMFIP